MPMILPVNALILLFCHQSQFSPDSLVSHQQACNIGGVEVIPHARAALASAGRKNTLTNISALELFVWYSTLALLWLAATAPVYRKKTPYIKKE